METVSNSGAYMRTLIVILTLVLSPCGALAAPLDECNGTWRVDAPATMQKSPGMIPDEDFLKLVLVIDAGAKTMRSEYPGRRSAPMSFTVEQEKPSEVTVKRSDGRIMRMQPLDKGRLTVGEIKNKQLRNIIYFVRQK
jgi:hypothetical protein